MNKILLRDLNITIYHKRMKNGLNVYIYPKDDVNNIYVTYNIKYGAKDLSFIPYNGNKYIKSPLGVAHFLEHKMFEESDHKNAMEIFEKRGASVNAFTERARTAYLFIAANKFKENLKTLLSFVDNPYFTDANVEKEKGIIIQELKMYHDNPDSSVYDHVLYNAFYADENRYPIGGTIDSVKKITKEDLYNCYKTFYVPNNMILTITGKVDVNKTFNLISEIKLNNHKHRIKHNKIKEKDVVFKQKETIKMDVEVPKVRVAFKIKLNKYNRSTILRYLVIFFKIKYGLTSHLVDILRKEGLIKYSLQLEYAETKNHLLVIIGCDAKDPKKVTKYILNELNDLSVSLKNFERIKKVLISNYFFVSDNIYSINDLISESALYQNRIKTNIKLIKRMNLFNMKRIINKINFSNNTIVTVLKNDLI